METKGFIRLNRSFFTNEVWTEPRRFSKAEAWLWMIASAHYGYEPKVVEVRGVKVTIQRGQFLSTIRNMANVFGWTKETTIKVLRQFLRQNMLKTATINATVGTLVTLCNYDKYNVVMIETATISATNMPKNRDNFCDIKEEIICIEEILKNNYLPVITHTAISKERGVWGENAISPTRKIFPYICNQKHFTLSLEQLSERYNVIPEWCAVYAPNVSKMKQPLRFGEFIELVGKYDIYDISRVLADMSNNKAISRQRSTYKTLRNWLEVDKVRLDRLECIDKHDYFKPAFNACKERGVKSIHQFLADGKKHSRALIGRAVSAEPGNSDLSPQTTRGTILPLCDGDVRRHKEESAGNHDACGIQ